MFRLEPDLTAIREKWEASEEKIKGRSDIHPCFMRSDDVIYVIYVILKNVSFQF